MRFRYFIGLIEKNMSDNKLYKCAKGCGSIEETDAQETPVCCGAAMEEISEDEVFGCGGCCSACGACGGASGAFDDKEDLA